MSATSARETCRRLTPKGDPDQSSPVKRFFHTRKDEPDRSCLAYRFFKWDAQNQDDLVRNATQAAASQLGRGLAETYWALHPERPPNQMGSWQSVLGPDRREVLLRLAGRLSAYIGPLVLAAIDKSVRAWSALATTTDTVRQQELAFQEELVKQDSIQDRLFRQCLLWRDLIRGERQPEDLLTNEDLNAPETADAWKKLKLYKLAAESLKVAPARRPARRDPARRRGCGDRKHDITAAHAHDIHAIGVLWGIGSEEELRTAGADTLAHTPAELASLLAPSKVARAIAYALTPRRPRQPCLSQSRYVRHPIRPARKGSRRLRSSCQRNRTLHRA